MQEHDETLIPCGDGLLEGILKADAFAGNKLFCVFLCVFVPTDDVPPGIEVKRSFKSETFGANEGNIAISGEIILP